MLIFQVVFITLLRTDVELGRFAVRYDLSLRRR